MRSSKKRSDFAESTMGLQSASEFDPHIVQYIGHVRDCRPHLTLEFAHLFALIFACVLHRGEPHLMLADPDRQIGTHLLNIRSEAQIARERAAADSYQNDGGLKYVPEIDLRAKPRP